MWLKICRKPPLDGIGSFKLNKNRCGGDWARRNNEGLVLNSKSDLNSGRCTNAGGAVRLFVPMSMLPKKTHAGTGGNKLLILYLVFAATIATRYRKVISE
ncbi:hypothetical protein FFE80_04920 [Rhizobium rhizogenes]|nr:hypothetical protein FFE80_04920 [Rhizobium rhizogenes]